MGVNQSLKYEKLKTSISVDQTFTINMVVCLDLFRVKTGSLFNLENIWVLGNRNFWKVRAVSDKNIEKVSRDFRLL